MTISANSTFNPTVDNLIRSGMQLAGLLPFGRAPQPDQLRDVREILDTRLKELQAEGTILLTAERAEPLTLASGTASYALPANVLDVDELGMLTAPGETTQTHCFRMPFNDYQPITDKATTGVPMRFYVEKLAATTIIFHPTPDKAYAFSYRKIRLLADVDSGGVTVDLRQKWLRVVTLMIAHDVALAGSRPLSVVEYLDNQLAIAKQIVSGDDDEKGDLQWVL
jgi:hypothetical protein